MAKVKKKELVKHVKALNKLELTEDPIEVSGDVDEIKEGFIEGIEEIDDDNAIDEVPDSILDYYESLIEDAEGDDDDDDDDEDEEKPKKKKKKGKKKKAKKKKDKKPEDEDDDEDDDDDDDEDEEPPAKKKKAKGKKKKKAKKEKKPAKKKKAKKKKAKSDLPKGLRTGTLPAAIYEKIKEGEATWAELAEVVAEEKDKEAESCMGLAMRTVSRKVSKAIEVQVIFNGEDDTAIFSLAEDPDVPDEDDDDDDDD